MYLVEEMKNIFICPTMLQCRAKIDVVIIPLYVQTWLQEGMNKNKKKTWFSYYLHTAATAGEHAWMSSDEGVHSSGNVSNS